MEVCSRMSGSCEDAFLDKGIEKAEIAKSYHQTVCT